MGRKHLHVTVDEQIMKELQKRRNTANGKLSLSEVVNGILEREFFIDGNQHRLDVQ